MKIACQDGMVKGRDFRKKLEKLEEFGYEGVEIGGRGLLGDREWAKEVIKATKKSVVRPSTICAGFRGCPLGADKAERDLAVGDLKDLLDIGGELELEGGLIFVPVFGQAQSTVGLFKLTGGDDTAVRAQVELGRSSVSTIEIVRGLDIDDQVILSDMSRWDEFDRIRLR